MNYLIVILFYTIYIIKVQILYILSSRPPSNIKYKKQGQRFRADTMIIWATSISEAAKSRIRDPDKMSVPKKMF